MGAADWGNRYMHHMQMQMMFGQAWNFGPSIPPRGSLVGFQKKERGPPPFSIDKEAGLIYVKMRERKEVSI